MAIAAPDVLIAGAGPVGLAAALELRRLGFTVRIVERHARRAPYSKALGVNSRTLELLEPLGVTQSMIWPRILCCRLGDKILNPVCRPAEIHKSGCPLRD